MKSKWVAGIKSDEKKDFIKRDFINARPIRERLIDILKKDIDAISSEMLSIDAFDKPAWAEYQASRIGEIRALRNVISLLSE